MRDMESLAFGLSLLAVAAVVLTVVLYLDRRR